MVINEIKTALHQRLMTSFISLDELNITDFQFSNVFKEAIESKQTAEQLALKAQRDLERIKIEGEQKVVTARAEAESQRIQKETISPIILQLDAPSRNGMGNFRRSSAGQAPCLSLILTPPAPRNRMSPPGDQV